MASIKYNSVGGCSKHRHVGKWHTNSLQATHWYHMHLYGLLEPSYSVWLWRCSQQPRLTSRGVLCGLTAYVQYITSALLLWRTAAE